MVGKSLGHYEVVELLGAGSMGEVYRALDTNLKRDVAIKVLPEELAEDTDRLARLQREAHLLAAVNHPNIASIYNLEEAAGTRFLVLELIEGESLADMIPGRLPVDDALKLCGQVAEALEAAHKAGIIHRDLKPANIMVTPARRAKVLDFGIGKTAEDGAGSVETAELTKLTRTGTIVGTAPYMSPEQVRAQPLDKRTDIWAFGCVLYETLTGKKAFGRGTVGDTMSAILEHEPDWSALPTNTPMAVDSLLRRCLQKDPQLRLRDIGDAWIEINELLVSSPGTRPTVATTGDSRGRTAINKRIGYVGATIGILAAATAVAIGVLKFGGPAETEPTSAPTHRQITFAGDASDAAISPDGTSVVYVTGKAGEHQRLMLADLAGGQAIEIFNGSTVQLPVWSPDGSAITVSALKGGLTPTRVYLVPRLGGDPRRLSSGLFTTWAPDGLRMAFALINSGFRTFSESTGSSALTADDGYDFTRGLSWSPTDDRLAVLTNTTATGVHEIFTVDPSGNNRTSVVRLRDPMSSPRWAPGGDAIYFLRHRNNLGDILRVDRTQGEDAWGEPTVVLSGLQAAQAFNSTFNLTADGRTLVYSTRRVYSNLWLAELPPEESDQAPELRQLTSGTSLIEQPSISPDGQWIAYSAQASSGANIFKMPISGGDPVQLTFSDTYQTSPVWSPEGSSIAFTARDADGASVWVMGSDGTGPREFPQTEVSVNAMRVVWSPGDRPLYQRPGNQNFSYLNVATGEEQPMVPEVAFERRRDEPGGYRGYTFRPEYSPDGRQVAVSWNRPPAQSLWLITREPYSERMVSEEMLNPIGWSPEGEWIFVIQVGGSSFGRVPVGGGDREQLFTLSGKIAYGSVDPDGRSIVAPVITVQSDVFLVEDFDRRQR